MRPRNTSPKGLSRRSALGRVGALAALIASPALAQTRTWRIGTTSDHTAVERANGLASTQGAQACFNAWNRSGGIHGAKLELVHADDQFKPEQAKAHALNFQSDKSVLALLSPLGTRQTAAMMDAVKDMAIVGPITGTSALRKSSPPNLFWVRATYDQEVNRLVSTAVTLGITRIGLVCPNDPLGNSVQAAFLQAMSSARLEPHVIAKTPGTTSLEVRDAVDALTKAQPQMTVMGLAGVVPVFVKAVRSAGIASTLYGLSIGASASNLDALGAAGRGIGFAIVVPPPNAPKFEIVRRYQADMRASGWAELSLPSLEGYINAQVLVEGLRQAGPQADRATLIAALDRLESLDLGGLRIGYGKGNRNGGRFVDVAVIGQEGRLIS